jgi:DNA-binding response OmpR family regulator
MQPAAARPPRILIAEDTPTAAELMQTWLEEEGGFEVGLAIDGEETLRRVNDWKPDLVLLDVMMPRISGFEVCKRLRASPATHDIAVLMITALDQHSDIDRAVEAGTDDFLSKPIARTELLRRVRALLAARQKKSDLDRTLSYIEEVERGPDAPPKKTGP